MSNTGTKIFKHEAMASIPMKRIFYNKVKAVRDRWY